MIIVKFTKRPNTSFYWENPQTLPKYTSLITSIKTKLGENFQVTHNGNETQFAFNVGEHILKQVLNENAATIDDMTTYSNSVGIEISSPV